MSKPTWTPTDWAAVDQRNRVEILTVAAAGRRIYLTNDTDDGDCTYRFDNQPGDEIDGSYLGDEVTDLIGAGLLTDQGGVVRITDAGRAYLVEAVR